MSRAEAITAARASAADHVAVWWRAEPQGVVLDKPEAIRRIESAVDESQFMVVPLPGKDASAWQSLITQTTASPAVTAWLTGPGSDAAALRDRQARREAELEAERASREKLQRTFFDFLLGDRKPAAVSAGVATTQPAQ